MLSSLINNTSAAGVIQRKKAKRISTFQSGVLLSILLALSVTSYAQQPIEADGTQWGQWQALDTGFIARRKVPPRMERAPKNRALKSVKSQPSRLLKTKATLLTEMKTLDQQSLQSVQSQLHKVDAKLSLVRTINSPSSSIKQDGGAWLYNGTEGLHAVSLEDLADALGQTESRVATQLKANHFSLTNNGQAVSYHYDEAAARVSYVAESYQTVYSDENAYRARLLPGSFRAIDPDEFDVHAIDSYEVDFRAIDTYEVETKAMKVQTSTISDDSLGAGVATAFPDTLLFEEEPDLYFDIGSTRADPDADYWFWDYLFGPNKNTITVTLNAPNPAQTGAAQLRIKMRGWTDLYPGNEHKVIAELNNQAVGAVLIWDAYDEAILVADFDQGLLDSNGNNSLTIRSIYSDGNTPGEYLDNIELDYMRLPLAQDGQLWLHQVTQGTQRVSGFSSDNIVVIEDPKGSALMRQDVTFDSDAGSISVVFEAKAGVDYLVVEQDAVMAPQLFAAEAASLRNPANMGDYLIIAPRDFAGTEKALTRLREAQFAHVKTVWLDQIYAEYSAGRVDPFAIGRFMQDINATWSVTPTHVVILGNGSLDHKNRMGYDESFVPPMLTVTRDVAPWTLASSDDRLLGANGDAAFAIGRIPILSDAEGMAYVEKLRRYERAALNVGSKSAVLLADNPDTAGQFDANSQILSSFMTGRLGFSQATVLEHSTGSVVRNAFIDSATWDDHNYLSYDGHGGITQLGDFREKFITTADADALSNSQYPLFTALTCAAGEYVFPGVRSLSAAMVLNPTGGAIAAMAPTGLSLDEDAQFLGYVFTGTLFGSSNSTIGEALGRAKILSAGEVNDFMTRIYSVIGDPAVGAH
ncbi:MAG: hypothetical protein ACI9XU_000559 [Arenicella sp.]|jgi:hypothetical protein